MSTETSTVERNREGWLTDFANLALPLITKRTGLSVGDRKFQISCGFPASGGKKRKNGGFTSGVCFHTHNSDGAKCRERFQIFIHPAYVDPMNLGEVICHELIHSLLPSGVGHRRPFSQACRKMGLLPDENESVSGIAGKPTATQLSKELAEHVKAFAEQLGPYPHEKLEASGKVQGSRLLKVSCPMCGYVTRTTATWIDGAGCTICPQCNIQMEQGDGGEVSDPLIPVHQAVEYKIKPSREEAQAAAKRKSKLLYDPRWSIWMERSNGEMTWSVLDLGPSEIDGMAVMGIVTPRRTVAESRQDAIALLEALRDGTMTYDDIETNDDDPDLDEFDDIDYDDDEGEILDFDDDSDPRFAHEVARGVQVADINPDAEADKREAWANREVSDAC